MECAVAISRLSLFVSFSAPLLAAKNYYLNDSFGCEEENAENGEKDFSQSFNWHDHKWKKFVVRFKVAAFWS